MEGEGVCRMFLHEKWEVSNGWGLVGVEGAGGEGEGKAAGGREGWGFSRAVGLRRRQWRRQ